MTKVVLFKSFSASYQNVFESSGLQVTFIEPLQFKFTNLDLLQQKLSHEYDGIIFTSPRGIEAASKCWKESAKLLWNQRKVYTVGEASATKIKELLDLKSSGSESGNAENLSRVIMAENIGGTKFLFPGGNLKSETIVENLNSKGILVDAICVYETQENEHLHDELKNIFKSDDSKSMLFFFSPSGVEFVMRHLMYLPVNLKNINFYSIGTSTNKKLMELGIRVSGVARTPTAESLIEAMVKNKQAL